MGVLYIIMMMMMLYNIMMMMMMMLFHGGVCQDMCTCVRKCVGVSEGVCVCVVIYVCSHKWPHRCEVAPFKV